MLLPAIRGALVAGLILALGRALGEVGIKLMPGGVTMLLFRVLRQRAPAL